MYLQTSPDSISRARVLIAAYEADTCLMLTGLLAREGFYTALMCETKGFKQVLDKEEPPHAFVLDDSFGGEQTEAMIRLIRSAPKWTRVRVIVLSSRDSEDAETTMLDIGADDFVAKPIKPKALVARIKRRLLNG